MWYECTNLVQLSTSDMWFSIWDLRQTHSQILSGSRSYIYIKTNFSHSYKFNDSSPVHCLPCHHIHHRIHQSRPTSDVPDPHPLQNFLLSHYREIDRPSRASCGLLHTIYRWQTNRWMRLKWGKRLQQIFKELKKLRQVCGCPSPIPIFCVCRDRVLLFSISCADIESDEDKCF